MITVLIKEQMKEKLKIVNSLDKDTFFASFIKENHAVLKPIVAALKNPDSQTDTIHNNEKNIQQYFSSETVSKVLSDIIKKAVSDIQT